MESFVKFWPIFTWVICTVFALGVMWWKVESARGAVKLLFEKVAALENHTAKHCAELDALKAGLERLDRNMASNVIRMDQIYQILTQKKE